MAAATTTVYGLVFLALVIVGPCSGAGINCGQVAGYLVPCNTYVGSGGVVPPNCCAGIKNLNDAAGTTPDRRAACQCIKSIMTRISGLKPGLAAGLPRKCGVSIPYAISASTDCSRVT